MKGEGDRGSHHAAPTAASWGGCTATQHCAHHAVNQPRSGRPVKARGAAARPGRSGADVHGAQATATTTRS
eukprot:scaffold11266_cov162-Isochrysis_galbana.AAC.2